MRAGTNLAALSPGREAFLEDRSKTTEAAQDGASDLALRYPLAPVKEQSKRASSTSLMHCTNGDGTQLRHNVLTRALDADALDVRTRGTGTWALAPHMNPADAQKAPKRNDVITLQRVDVFAPLRHSVR